MAWTACLNRSGALRLEFRVKRAASIASQRPGRPTGGQGFDEECPDSPGPRYWLLFDSCSCRQVLERERALSNNAPRIPSTPTITTTTAPASFPPLCRPNAPGVEYRPRQVNGAFLSLTRREPKRELEHLQAADAASGGAARSGSF